MGNGATTRTVGLLERSAELDALDGHEAAVREQGRGRLVLIAGEAGIGKTALVRAFCDARRPRPRPVGRAATRCSPRARSGRSSTSPTSWAASSAPPWPMARPPAHVARGADAIAARPAARRRRARGPALGRRGDARRPAPARPPHRVAPGARAWPATATTSSIRATRCGSSWASCPAAAAGATALGAAVGARSWPARRRGRGRSRGELHRRTAGNPFYVTEVLRRGRRPDPRDGPRRRARPRRAARRAGARRCWTPWPSRRRAPSCGCSRR